MMRVSSLGKSGCFGSTKRSYVVGYELVNTGNGHCPLRRDAQGGRDDHSVKVQGRMGDIGLRGQTPRYNQV